MTLLYVLYYKILFQWIKRKRRNETIARCLDNIVAEGEGDRICFYFGDEKWTYKQVCDFCKNSSIELPCCKSLSRNWSQKRDSVGLAMTNRPEMAATWIGLGRIGVISVLINTNLRGDSLLKTMSEVRNGKQSDLLCPNIYELSRFMEDPKWIPANQDFTHLFPTIDLAACLFKVGPQPTSVTKDQEPNYLDPILYLFTSGTTGIPKAVACSHGRLCFLASTASAINFSPNDVTYSPLPMYHAGGLFSPMWAFVYRSPCVLVVKFSATNFWKDVHKYKVTVCMYVGELCRFLHNQPVNSELEVGHSLRAFFGGGGLRPEVWAAFQERFKVKTFSIFMEVQKETEKIGACGYIPIWLQPSHPIQLIKLTRLRGEIVRDEKTGFAIRCQDGKPGELIGKIIDSVPMSRFDGYTDKEATEKRIARNVFKQGDKYGYYYFQDRIGDTFRWKAENVATTMVEAVISKVLGMRDNTVYYRGLRVQLCMAAILDATLGQFDIQSLTEGMKLSLPKYAMPMFIRLISNSKGLDMTGTLKFQKFRLRDDGFNIEGMRIHF
ncbi:Long-chain fatty acid transport protein 4 [Orchesella cincta]|uniref:Long-chain-fatty-acid--CoA ligase n=1 Tax=Orchesella cincta TaxID=48709 RepID=A0A1D2M4S8_ORCCI|nr:Long-chain fatty acid transport protein 4 [Orchesella cincta]